MDLTLQNQSGVFMRQLETRRRRAAKPATLAAYRSYLNTWILPELGRQSLEEIENGVIKIFVTKLSEAELSAASIVSIVSLIKQIVKSCVDQNGNCLYPRVWNNDFIDLPIINPDGQKAPIMTQLELNRAISTVNSHIRPLVILLAASGLRISEALALKSRPSQDSSYYDSERHVLVIKKALYKGKEQATKTSAGTREVDLAPSLTGIFPQQTGGFMFCNVDDKPFDSTSRYLRDSAAKAGIPGFHSLRRFRRTHLEACNVPAGLSDFWLGHQGKGMAGRYVKIGSDIESRKLWAEKAGLGFEL